jgi:site-specific recombinase XerD
VILENPYIKYILPYWEKLKDRGEIYLFPRPQTRTGHIYEKYVWDVIQMLDLEQPVWSHLFRGTLATEMAEDEATAFQLKSWFDWENIATADEYVTKAGVSTKKLSDRMW